MMVVVYIQTHIFNWLGSGCNCIMVFNATFNNILVLLVEKTADLSQIT